MNKPFSKKITIIILTALALVTVGLGYGLLVLSQKENDLNWNFQVNNPNHLLVDNESKDVQVLTTTTDTSDWLTYRNEKYGWEVKYPKGYEIVYNKENGNTYFHPPKSGSIQIEKNGDNPNNLTIEEIFKQRDWPVSGRNKIALDGSNIIGFGDKLDKNQYREFTGIDFTENGYVFNINWHDNLKPAPENYRTFIDMLTTFKFYK